MNDLLIYLLKVSAGVGIIYIPYYFLIRNDPNLNVKRFYLLTGLAASWIFPFISFSRPDLFLNVTPTVIIDPNESVAAPITFSGEAAQSGLTINWIKLFLITYLTGLFVLFFKNILILLKWNRIFQRSNNSEGIAYTEGDQVFAIFTRIFIPSSLQNKPDVENVVLHEQAHIQQLHFIDLVIVEITLLLTWFNPFSWLISRMIKENHEHLADRQVLSAGVNPARYRAQLLNHTLGVNVFRLGNQFNHSLTLKRFNMMKKPRKSYPGMVKIALLIPAVLITLGLTTGMEPQQKPIKGKVVIAETGEAAPGASLVIAGTTTGTVADINGEFKLNVEGDPDIVISFVGYKTIRIKASKIGNKPLKLQPETYRVDLEDVPLEVSRKIEEGEPVQIRIKGQEDKQPVYVLDGKVVKGIDNIDPNDIDHIEVLKDPDHELAKTYNAKHGLILIVTKNGKDMLEPKEALEVVKKSDKKPEGEVFFIVEEMPMFPGGKAAMKTYIYSTLKYPSSLINKGVEGTVNVQFVVTASGKLENIHAATSTNKAFEEPALEVFRGMPDWRPGSQRGKPVRVQVVVPVKFSPPA